MPASAEALSQKTEVREHPLVVFRVSENTWLETIVRYLVAPREAGSVKTRLIKKLLPALHAALDKVLFPKGPSRQAKP
jgi:hypothetical protein